MKSKSSTTKCPLCGFEFEKTQAICTHGCPLGRFCKLIRCPNCHYEFPEPSRPLAWLSKLLHPSRPARRDALDLTQLAAGTIAEFVELAGAPESRRHTLSLYGLIPGAHLTLEQKQPAYVIRVGETELALDREIARQILVRPLPTPHASPPAPQGAPSSINGSQPPHRQDSGNTAR